MNPTDVTADETRLKRATQELRTRQSRLSMPLVILLVGVIQVYYWGETPKNSILIWGVLVTISISIRALVANWLSGRIGAANTRQLAQYERLLFATSMLNGLAVGSGFWLVGIYEDTTAQNLIYIVLLFAAIYAFGSMVNASAEYRSFAPTIIVNLGQGILYFAFFAPEEIPGFPITIAILINIMLQLGFGFVHSRQFAESVSIRSENVRLLEELQNEKALVENALATAKEANESKSRFLAAASHDLRQPLHALSLFLGALVLQLKDESSKALVDKISDTTQLLRDQFNALLDLSQFDAGGVPVELQSFRLDQLLEKLGSEFSEQAHQKGLSLSLNTTTTSIYSDPLLVERMLRNLLQNAIRYTDTGSISISADDDGSMCRVVVADTGSGISEEDQKRIFDDFVQLHNQQRHRDEGVGLGLAIVRRINKLLNADLQLTSSANSGTQFRMHFPISKGPALHQPFTATGHNNAFTDTDIWMLDDDAEVAEAMSMQLKAWGCNTNIVLSWKDLQQMLERQERHPDLILLDDMLGDEKSGLEIAHLLKDQMSKDRIVLITGNTIPERLEQIRQSGFNLLLKPTQPSELLALLTELTQEKK